MHGLVVAQLVVVAADNEVVQAQLVVVGIGAELVVEIDRLGHHRHRS